MYDGDTVLQTVELFFQDLILQLTVMAFIILKWEWIICIETSLLNVVDIAYFGE